MRRRPSRASRVLMLLSVLVAVVTTLVLRGHLARLEARAAAGGPGTPAVVAVVGAGRGDILTSAMIRVEARPSTTLPPGALRSLDQAEGATLDARVVAGEILTRARLAPPGGPIAALVPPGLRAVPIRVPVPTGSVVAGDHVDVLGTFAAGAPHTETVAPAVEVLAVLQGGPAQAQAGPALLVLVSPDVAERIAYASAFADLSVAIAPPPPVAPPTGAGA